MSKFPFSEFAVIGPANLNCCFEAAEVLARTNGEDVRAQFSADPGVTQCASCNAWVMREGEALLCGQCGAITHVATGNLMRWDEAWLVNHRPPKQQKKGEHDLTLADEIVRIMDMDQVALRVRDDIDLETSLLMELDIAQCILIDELKQAKCCTPEAQELIDADKRGLSD